MKVAAVLNTFKAFDLCWVDRSGDQKGIIGGVVTSKRWGRIGPSRGVEDLLLACISLGHEVELLGSTALECSKQTVTFISLYLKIGYGEKGADDFFNVLIRDQRALVNYLTELEIWMDRRLLAQISRNESSPFVLAAKIAARERLERRTGKAKAKSPQCSDQGVLL